MTTKLTDKNISNVANLGIQWQAVITADGSTATTAVAGRGYLIDTTSNAHTINLPASAIAGDTIAIKDYAGTFATNNLTIGRNGSNIQGVANDSLISSARASLELVYVNSTRGWVYTNESNVAVLGPLYITATGGTVTTSGDYKIHSFTGDGCFVVSCGGNVSGSNSVDYLVVAGGGGGGGRDHGGGGGAGGYRESSGTASGCYSVSPLGACVSALPVSATTYPVTVGGGGAGFRDGCTGGNVYGQGTDGSNSVFSTITSTGGGGGNANCFPGPTGGRPGGSGGGGSQCNSPVSIGAGNTPPVNPPQGNPGTAAGYAGPNYGHSSGGGATSSGTAGTPTTGGQGGNGATTSISGSPTTYAGGGGGSTYQGGNLGAGGPGGGGNGTIGGPAPNSTNGTAGTANTGGGGGGGERSVPDPGGKAGGKGIVIIRYKFQN